MTYKEAIEKYGKITLVFASYYKYSFTYRGFTKDNLTISMTVGGSGEGIYRADMKYSMTVKDIDYEAGSEYSVIVIDGERYNEEGH